MVFAQFFDNTSGAAGSHLRVGLSTAEMQLLQSLPERLKQLLLDPHHSPKVISRLFPACHEDPCEQAEHQKLIGDSLLEQRLEALALYAKTFQRAESHTRLHLLTLTSNEIDLWLHVINDVRLMIATELNVTDNDWHKKLPRDSDELMQHRLLAVLSVFQEVILQALAQAGERIDTEA